MNIFLFISFVLMLFGGCTPVSEQYEHKAIVTVNIKSILENNDSEGVVSFWQIQKTDSRNNVVEWMKLVIIPNDENNEYDFKGVIVNPGSLYDHGIRTGDPIMYISKMGSSNELTAFWGIWNYSTNYSKEWKAVRFDINSQNGIIYNSQFISYQAFKYHDDQSVVVSRRSNKASNSNSSSYASSSSTSGYGEISENTGRSKTVHVNGYHRKDGTYVKPHYRSPPRRK